MEGFYGWIRNIICYLLFITVIENLLPGKKYGKYLKLFSGMVLILLIMQPIVNGLRLEDKIAHYYEAFVFQYESDDLKQELLGIEDQRLEQMFRQYESAVAEDINQMVEEAGLLVVSSEVSIQRDKTRTDYGQVQLIRLSVCEEGASEQVSTSQGVTPVEPVVIGTEGSQEAAEALAGKRQQEEQKTAGTEKLQKKIVSYYDLEDDYVEIQFVEG